MSEVELQYLLRGAPRPAMVPSELAGFQLHRAATYRIDDTYYDDEALGLRRSGQSLRIRRQGDRELPLVTWKGPATRLASGAKSRDEVELPLDAVPADGDELRALLVGRGLWERICGPAELPAQARLRAIGALQNRRSAHVYLRSRHALELTWDRVKFPVGAPQTRLEVEVKSPEAARFLDAVDAELRDLYGRQLRPAEVGKTKELCLRLYPGLLARPASRAA